MNLLKNISNYVKSLFSFMRELLYDQSDIYIINSYNKNFILISEVLISFNKG